MTRTSIALDRVLVRIQCPVNCPVTDSVNTNLEPKQFSDGAIDILQKYHWPGNVRELKNLVERLVIMTKGDTIDGSNVPSPYNQEPEILDRHQLFGQSEDVSRSGQELLENLRVAVQR